MKEARYYERSPLVYGAVRRIEMTRYVLSQKRFHEDAPLFARLRALWLILCGHETEICCLCGGKVGVVWWCDSQELWTELTGWTDGGIFCVQCFDRRAERQGILIRWIATEDCRRRNDRSLRVHRIYAKQMEETTFYKC